MKNPFLKFTLAILVLVSLATFQADFIGQIFGSPVIAFGVFAVLMVKSFLPTARIKGALYEASSVNLTKLTDTLGAYCQENRDILVKETLLDEDFEKRYTLVDEVTDELPLPNLQMGDLVKPADPLNFTPTSNAVNFDARVLKVRGCKVDIQLVPQLMEKTWLGKMKKPNDVFEMPFEDYILQQINAKTKENIRLNALYKGVYNASGTTPSATMNGFEKLIDIELAANNPNLVPVVTGAITSTNIADKLQLVYDSLGEAYKGVPTVCDLPPQYFDWYVRKFQPVINPTLVVTNGAASMEYPVVTEVPLIGTNAILRREPGKSLNKPFVFTLKDNTFLGVDSSTYAIEIQKFNRSLKIMIDFKMGVNYAQLFSGAVALNQVYTG